MNRKIEHILQNDAVSRAGELLGWEGAFNWMLLEHPMLGGKRPVDALATTEGREKIEKLLNQFRTT